MNKLSIFVMLLLCAVFSSFAQPDSLVFTVNFNTPYQNLTNPTIVTSTDWDDFDATIPLGFTFKAMDDTTSSLYFNENDFNTGTDLQFKTSAMTSNPFNLISWILDLVDLHLYDSSKTSNVGYRTDVVAGKKITKIEWNNVGFYDDPDSIAFANVQLWLYEDKNAIEYRFGNSSADKITAIANGIYGFNGPIFAFVKDFNTSSPIGTMIYMPSGINPPTMDSANIFQLMNSPSDYGIDSFPKANTLFRWAPAEINTKNNSVALNDNITIYPNPSSDFLNINMKRMFGYRLCLYAMNGVCVKQEQLNEKNNKVDLRSLAGGNYFLVLSNDQERIHYKITKQ